jgi:hypothetical protein
MLHLKKLDIQEQANREASSKVWEQVLYQVQNQVKNQIPERVCIQVENLVWEQVRSKSVANNFQKIIYYANK